MAELQLNITLGDSEEVEEDTMEILNNLRRDLGNVETRLEKLDKQGISVNLEAKDGVVTATLNEN